MSNVTTKAMQGKVQFISTTNKLHCLVENLIHASDRSTIMSTIENLTLNVLIVCTGEGWYCIDSTKSHELLMELYANAARTQRVRLDNKCNEKTGRIRNKYCAIDERTWLGRQRGYK